MKVTHSAPSPAAEIVDSEDEYSTTTGAGDSNTEDLNTSQLLGDDEVVGDRTEEDIASIPISHVLIKIMDQSFEIAAQAKITLNTTPVLPTHALRLNPNPPLPPSQETEAKKDPTSSKPRGIKATLKNRQKRLRNRHVCWLKLQQL